MAKQTGVPVSQLMAAKGMNELKLIVREHNVAQKEQSRTPVTRPDNSTVSPDASQTRTRRIEQLTNKSGDLTDKEHAELQRYMES